MTTINLPDQRIEDLLINAFECGCSYWLDSAVPLTLGQRLDYTAVVAGTQELECALNDPEDVKGGLPILNREQLLKGLQLMAEKAPRHFANILSEDDDAETADVFLQFVLIGEIMYG